jgi:hypothetical protein
VYLALPSAVPLIVPPHLDLQQVSPQAGAQEGVGAKGLDAHKAAQADQLHPAQATNRKQLKNTLDSLETESIVKSPLSACAGGGTGAAARKVKGE